MRASHFILALGGVISIPLVIAALFVLSFAGKGCSFVPGWADRAMTVVADQVDPAAMLKKYEWFKDAAAQCDKKRADISVYQARISSLQQTYAGIPRTQWARADMEQYNVWLGEVAGVIASYNLLAAEYNAAMAKINYAFCNVGSVPAGGAPLPREFREYISQ